MSNRNKNSNNLRERSFRFSLDIIKLIKSLPNKKLYWTISDQLLRSATSIGANIIEAKSASSKRDFIRFYEISLKSANETVYWLMLLKAGKLSTHANLDLLLKENEELCKMLAASLLTLKGKRK